MHLNRYHHGQSGLQSLPDENNANADPIAHLKQHLAIQKADAKVLLRMRSSPTNLVRSSVSFCVSTESKLGHVFCCLSILCWVQTQTRNRHWQVKLLWKNFSNSILTVPLTCKKTLRKEDSMAKRVESKVEAFDIKGAVRALSSEDIVATFDLWTLHVLKYKHPVFDNDVGNLPWSTLHWRYYFDGNRFRC